MAVPGEGTTNLMKFIWFVIGHILVIIIGLLLWRWIWLKRIGIELPVDK